MGIEAACLNIINAIYDKPTASIRLSGGNLESFSSKSRNKTRITTLASLVSIVLKNLSIAIGENEEYNETKLERKE